MTSYGRSEDEWITLTEAGQEFLVERARLARTTSYTELNTTLVRRTGLPGFDFGREADRAAMGQLLYRVVAANRPQTKLMISALVIYLNGNDAGSGFYALAQQLGELPQRATATAKEEFWIGQVKALYAYYGKAGAKPGR
ncbi:hypothetical protein ACFQY4_17325 [Catellatospora bangladeshensis]|uniref:Uncharacterized protein n=1 Tax=Catellatospora bangladeshensis TaxID=310355 RepID=A0A8J3NNN4_9ACTN|nr:hypothetical protein [Catellatospora bangladeshensis]GIF86293.1 hypothetical protein Cba03nite_76420 [Catellatospora bangladeshensis]